MPAVISADGTWIGYSVTGRGPTLLYIAGALMYRAIDECGAGMAAALSRSFTVVTYDRRGRGDSGDTAPYAVRREVEDIAALVAQVGAPAVAMGESSGAVLALEAVLSGAPITRLALYEPPFIVTNDTDSMPADFLDRLDALIASDRRDEALEVFMTLAAGLPAEAVAAARTSQMWPAVRAVAHTIAYDTRVMGDTRSGDPATLHRFAPVDIPVRALAGGQSPAHQRDAVVALCSVLPHAQLRIAAGQGHQFDPATVAPLVAEFLEEPTRQRKSRAELTDPGPPSTGLR